jgi:hypothetical protein
MSFFFRYRRIGALPTVAIAYGYFAAFSIVNNMLYKLIVDGPLQKETRMLGLGKHCHPLGTHKNRNVTFQ